mgnify:CR=1 FL=1
MSNAITISGTTYTVTGTVKNKDNNEGIEDLIILVESKLEKLAVNKTHI